VGCSLRGDHVKDETKVLLLVGLFVAAKLPRFGMPKILQPSAGPEWWKKTNKGGRGSGAGSTSAPGPAGAVQVWSEATMRTFVEELAHASAATLPNGGGGIDPEIVLLGIAAASNFNADEFLGSNTGLLMVRRQDLAALGYPGVPSFEEIDAPHQIPWIARVIAYRMQSTGAPAPKSVGDLAVLLNPGTPTITDMLRSEAERRANEALGTMVYMTNHTMLEHVLANPPGVVPLYP